MCWERPSSVQRQFSTCLNFQWTKWNLLLQPFRVKWSSCGQSYQRSGVFCEFKAWKFCQEGEVAKCKLSVLRLWLCFGWSYHFWYVLCPALWAAWCMVSNPASWAASNASVMEKWTVTPEEKDYLLIPLRWWMGPVKPAVLLGRASFFWGSAGCLARIPPVALQSLGFGTDIAVRTETTPLNF